MLTQVLLYLRFLHADGSPVLSVGTRRSCVHRWFSGSSAGKPNRRAWEDDLSSGHVLGDAQTSSSRGDSVEDSSAVPRPYLCVPDMHGRRRSGARGATLNALERVSALSNEAVQLVDERCGRVRYRLPHGASRARSLLSGWGILSCR